jgi:hypothetical protein
MQKMRKTVAELAELGVDLEEIERDRLDRSGTNAEVTEDAEKT